MNRRRWRSASVFSRFGSRYEKALLLKVAVVGSGRMGAALGRIWAQCGHQVTFSFSRNEETLQGLSREAGGAFGSVAEAVADADAVLLSVPWPFVDLALSQAEDLSGKVVLNCCVPHDEKEERLVVGSHTSGAEELAKRYPDVRWVSAFNTSPSESLPVVHARRDQASWPQLLFYGDDERAKRVAEMLIRDVGFKPLDLGGLENARFVEPFAMVTAVLAYDRPGGPVLTYRFEKIEV